MVGPHRMNKAPMRSDVCAKFWAQNVNQSREEISWGILGPACFTRPGFLRLHHVYLERSTICWVNQRTFDWAIFKSYPCKSLPEGMLSSSPPFFFDSVFLQSLVGGIPTPLENDGLRQLGWWHSQLNGKSSNFIFPKHQPVYHFPISQYSVITILNR